MRNVMKKMVLTMAALALLEDLANGAIRHQCYWSCAQSCGRNTARSQGWSVPTQVLTMLGFLATGAFQRELADRSGVCQSTLSRAMPAVWDGIIRMSSRYIKFPYNAVEQANIKAQFAARAGFPNVIRAIDCTHIAIKAPSKDEFVYVNRKHLNSINVQIICDV
ncbi:putative nuclease HARBI1 [Merluccius polli]|uniref:Nuclease HARBI1 n=1 Tax=Merluccius polli TaxID=89951 RepID=A0AA47NSC2_MERPO|nr:putative nuclease HARBI1 [Merluccius polli]